MDRIDRGWAQELHAEIKAAQGPLLDQNGQEQVQQLLKSKFMMTTPEAAAVTAKINEHINPNSHELQSAVADALPAKMKHSAKMDATAQVMQVVKAKPPKM